MTAVTESPLPPRSRELKTNKPAAIGGEGEIMCVLVCSLCMHFCPCSRVTSRVEADTPILLRQGMEG